MYGAKSMHDLLLQISGLVAIAAALIHGVIGETKVFPRATIEPPRHWIVVTLACVFGFGALGNAWVTRGRHFGWMALSAVVALAVAGY